MLSVRVCPNSCSFLVLLATLALAGCSSKKDQPPTPSSSSAASAEPAPVASPDSSATAIASAAAPKPAGVQMPPLPDEEVYPETLEEQRAALLRRMGPMLHLTDQQLQAVKALMDRSTLMGQGNPAVTKYPLSRKECREKRNALGGFDPDEPLCHASFMTPIYDPTVGESAATAKACIDRYEFPGIPCEHPLVYASAREAVELCAAIGKRLCDAHEWEGSCAGAVHAPEDEYFFGKERKDAKYYHNRDREITWAYGIKKDHSLCGTRSHKSEGCTSSGWKKCGSNTFPAGSFPECRSSFGVYDLHGNVAEHMNLPLRPEELTSHGGTGETEMKGSWFIFANYEAHEDDCRWRAPDWHGTKIMDYNSHGNYHLGFRCCKDVGK
ncbi:MAG TPA: SUMF1/EgtB/PvdO family nonheme iron enzyme [Polyangium sp.]|nr:SUMF1/EgtB/PvdO family nonheme iron enzyme [Polyangium sp.]